ncbi:hypothetical protein LOZ80_28125 [Paenibacillus sp. HWE-109]|uniref:hypothetical protein n=1 Tax=Paenibacillus sp. HWE-109 TaxID=1306526 RepID=UPI001EDE42FA|nr:hypothetical protein [Paenibacillus sp. HWE-109]UKS25433.1 hypothetical protein LOZ80_28125 [Paenibacillus sp. HWE-109]
MLRIWVVVIVMICTLTGCQDDQPTIPDLKWFATKEEAIAKGLSQEGAAPDAMLAEEQRNAETLVFYEYSDGLGVASIAESAAGYSWYRSHDYIAFQGKDVPLMYGGLAFTTYKGQKLKVITGRVYDPSILKIRLKGDAADRELSILGRSRLFYSVHEVPLSRLEVVPISGV